MSEFKALLPNNSSQLERDLEKVMAARVEGLNERDLRQLKRADVCPEQWLPWLAWERRVTYWKDGWSLDTKRDVVDASIAVHRRKGTVRSVETAIAATGIDAVVSIGREHADYVPHTFRVTVDVDQHRPTPANVDDLLYMVDSHKPARCAYYLQFDHAVAVDSNTLRVRGAVDGRAAEDQEPHALRWYHRLLAQPTVVALQHTHRQQQAADETLTYRSAVSLPIQRVANLTTHLKEAA
ncbi:MAG: phage tail protein I [Thiothrix lacustris]|uniref:Phage tail protein I n=1 Tax=Thiothrix lacustris TaxID=525917 RepID=A0A1Y1QXH2_9GAMM|nr:MAG: phage tail protein I [Thiothrix lacustris]